MVEGRGGGASEHAIIKQWALKRPRQLPASHRPAHDSRDPVPGKADRGGRRSRSSYFESWAGILPEPFFQRWCVQPVASIIQALRLEASCTIPVIAFPRAAGLLYDGYPASDPSRLYRPGQHGAPGLGRGNDPARLVPLSWAAETIQRGLGRCIQGNLDPQMLVVGGDQMQAEVERILRQAAQVPFIFNLGHGILKTTPPQHVAALVKQVQGWRS